MVEIGNFPLRKSLIKLNIFHGKFPKTFGKLPKLGEIFHGKYFPEKKFDKMDYRSIRVRLLRKPQQMT